MTWKIVTILDLVQKNVYKYCSQNICFIYWIFLILISVLIWPILILKGLLFYLFIYENYGAIRSYNSTNIGMYIFCICILQFHLLFSYTLLPTYDRRSWNIAHPTNVPLPSLTNDRIWEIFSIASRNYIQCLFSGDCIITINIPQVCDKIAEYEIVPPPPPRVMHENLENVLI